MFPISALSPIAFASHMLYTTEQVPIATEKYKIRKYGKVAEENHLCLCPAAFSTTGEMGPSIKKLFLEQIRLKLCSIKLRFLKNQTKITISRWRS